MGRPTLAKWILGLALACGICPTGEAQEVGEDSGDSPTLV